MLKIGITGGIGTGKTTVCRIFETLGVPVFYADSEAKHAMQHDIILKQDVINYFGKEAYHPDGKLNNKYLANIVFNDENQLQRLNSVVHPAVFRAFDKWTKKLPNDTPYCLKEAALLFESGSYKMCDRNLLVSSPLDLRFKRVMSRDMVSQAQVQARMDKQMSESDKQKFADDLIHNDEQHSLILQVWELHQNILQSRADAN
jgi:dephospho-CoA kinase